MLFSSKQEAPASIGGGTFTYGMLNGKPVVKVNRDNVRLYLSKEEFEEDWKIVEKAED